MTLPRPPRSPNPSCVPAALCGSISEHEAQSEHMARVQLVESHKSAAGRCAAWLALGVCVCVSCMDLSLGDKIEHDECHSKAITGKMHSGRAGEHSIWPPAASV